MKPPRPLIWMSMRTRSSLERFADLPTRNEVIAMGSLAQLSCLVTVASEVAPVIPLARRRGIHLTLAVLSPEWARVEVILLRPTVTQLEEVRQKLARLSRGRLC